MSIRRRAILGVAAAVSALTLWAVTPAASAQVVTPCATCDKLNSSPGSGGPGFFDWEFHCDPATGVSWVNVSATTRDKGGLWLATVGDQTFSFSFKATFKVFLVNGQTFTRSIQDPTGKLVVGPKDEVFECSCGETVVTTVPTTVPGVTTVPSATTVPRATTTSVVAHATSTTMTGTLPASGLSISPWAVVAALIAVYFGALAVVHTRRQDD